MKTAIAILLLALLTACGSDYSSPFEAPGASAKPVDCAASGACS